MSLATAYFPPVVRKSYLDRLELPPRRVLAPELWADVHNEAQSHLEALATEVRRTLAGIRVDAGRTNGNNFYLFSYITFSMPDSAVDPVVVGITFTPAYNGVTVEADISGEQTGDPILSLPNISVAGLRKDLISAASTLARRLCQSAAAIEAAIKDDSRTVD